MNRKGPTDTALAMLPVLEAAYDTWARLLGGEGAVDWTSREGRELSHYEQWMQDTYGDRRDGPPKYGALPMPPPHAQTHPDWLTKGPEDGA